MADFTDQPLGILYEVARRELIHLLETLSGSKDLIVDVSLLRPLDKIASMSLLQKHGCARVVPLKGNTSLPWNPQVSTRVYMLRCTFEHVKMIVQHQLSMPDKKMAVIWVDRQNHLASRELEMAGIYGSLESFQLSMPLLPLESDLFSLELPPAAKVDLVAAAQSIFQLQSLYGLIPTVYGLGEQADRLWKILHQLYEVRGEPRASPDQPISHIYVFDRNIDLTTVLMTGVTYEAMLHDSFTISCGKIQFGPEVEDRMKPDAVPSGQGDYQPTKKSKVYVLDNNDGVFASIRNKHMVGVSSFLSAKAKEIQSSYDKGASIDQVQDMKDFVSNKLKQLKLQHRQLEMHICACEVLQEKNEIGGAERLKYEHELVAGTVDLKKFKEYLENIILMEYDPFSILCLVALASITMNGLPTTFFDEFWQFFYRTFGYEYVQTMYILAKKKIIFKKDKPLEDLAPPGAPKKADSGYPSFPFLKRRLNLVPKEEPAQDLKNPSRMNYVFSGAFTPVFCQVVADSMMHGWNAKELQKTFTKVLVEENSYTPADRRPDSRMKKAILVYFLGGVTYTEVAALRLLAMQNNFRVIIAATNIIHRDSFLKAMAEAKIPDVQTALKNAWGTKPRVYVKYGSGLYCRAHKHLRFLKRPYRPAWWAPNGLIMTIARSFRSKPSLPWSRELVEFPDGGVAAVDWLHPENAETNSHILVILPGITGHTHDAAYALHPAKEAHSNGWRVVVINPRGLGGVPLRTPKTYNAARTDDVLYILKEIIAARYPTAKKIGCGFSMGGMILWNYLATRTKENCYLDAGMSVSSPFDPFESTRSLMQPIPRYLLNGALARCLIETIRPHREVLEKHIDWDFVCKSRTINEFDKRFTAPISGYRNLEHYYEDAAMKPKVHKIPIPFLVLTSNDDYFAPIESLPLNEFAQSDKVIGIVTAHGGHTAYMESGNLHSRGFVERVLSQWSTMIVEDLH